MRPSLAILGMVLLHSGSAEVQKEWMCPAGKYVIAAGWVDGVWGGCAACPQGKTSTDPEATVCADAPVAPVHAGIGAGGGGAAAAGKGGGKAAASVGCRVSFWSAWSQCSKSCSFGGVQKRGRTVERPVRGGGRPCPVLMQERYCNAGRCPVRCAVSAWGAFGGCSKSCGGGVHARSRAVLHRAPLSRAGSVCPTLAQRAQCNVVPCSRNCAVGAWGAWSPCTASCGGGFATRSRKALSRARYGGVACPALRAHQNCGMAQCPADCVASVWSCGACTAVCGSGVRPCSRVLIAAAAFGGAACPVMSTARPCKAASCAPTAAPTPGPTLPPTPQPTGSPTPRPTIAPTPPPPFWTVSSWTNFIPSHASKGFCGDAEAAGEESGYLPVSKDRGRHLFFWFFEARPSAAAIAAGKAAGEGADAAAAAAIKAAAAAPLVLVLGGDPGCSSMLSLLTGAGPCTIDADLGTVPNPDSWTNHANVLWVEAPAGAGFSYDLYAGKRRRKGKGKDKDKGKGKGKGKGKEEEGEEEEDFDSVGTDLFIFVQEWMRVHPRFAPALAQRLLRSNADPQRAAGALRVRLQGVALGSPALNQLAMFESYGRYIAHNKAHLVRSIGRAALRAMRKGARRCTADILACQGTDAGAGATAASCREALALCAANFFAPLVRAGRSFADIRRPCAYAGGAGATNTCYDFGKETRFLRAAATRRQLGVRAESGSWRTCNHGVGGHFQASWMRDADGAVPELLKGGVRLLVWASDFDYIANWIGAKAWTMSLQWPGSGAFASTSDRKWLGEGSAKAKQLGEVRSSSGLTFLRVFGAGHRLAHDKPAVASLMIKTWLADQEF